MINRSKSVSEGEIATIYETNMMRASRWRDSNKAASDDNDFSGNLL